MSPITPADTLACLTQAFAEFTERWGQRKPTPTVVADFATLLFQQRIADTQAAINGASVRPTIFRVATIIELLRGQRPDTPSESSFRGNNRYQLDLSGKLDKLASYRTKDGLTLRVVGPEHRVGTEVHLYLDVIEVVVEQDAPATSNQKTRRAMSPSSVELLDAYQRLPAGEQKRYDAAIKAGARVEVSAGRFGKRRALIFLFLLLIGLAAFARWIVVRYSWPRHEQRLHTAGSAIEVTPPFRLDELRKVRVTPAMYYGVRQWSRSDVCTSDGVLAPSIHWEFKEEVAPPFVLLRNNEVYEDHIGTRDKHFTDYAAASGQTYAYALGKRNLTTGNIDVGSIIGFTVGKCGKRNRSPIVGIFPDPPGGTAPVTITFDVSYLDDKPAGGAMFNWLFGDGEMMNSRERRVTHEYKYGGEYYVTLSVSDSEGGLDNAALNLSVVGPPAPPAPPQEPERFWYGEDWSYVSKVRGRVDEDLYLRATPPPIPSGAKPVVYRWTFGDCLEDAMPSSSRFEKFGNQNCISDPFTVPDIQRRFARPGSFRVMLEITYDTGETMNRDLGSITVRPNEAYYAKHPDQRAWYSEPAPTSSEWDRHAVPKSTYR